jgi:hypothetical protein
MQLYIAQHEALPKEHKAKTEKQSILGSPHMSS